ncbi:MAG: bifunctional oligoribonuclease/PAP phosphatase NrnA [Candidatus Omnitrophota bacterium]
MKRRLLKKIAEKINSSKSFLITAHMNLEGDALGSELAVYQLLKELKKKVVIYNNDPTPNIYKFLPFSRVIKNSLAGDKFDVALVLDCSAVSRTGKVKDVLNKAGCIINIDHHVSNTGFGDINWVEPSCGSTAQILYQLCENFKIMDKNIALCLYTGIFTDTGNFTYANTGYQTHRVVSSLMKYNLHPHEIYDNIHSLCMPVDLNFIGKIISSLKLDPRRKISWATITDWRDKNYDLTEVIFSIMRLLKDPEVFLLFKKVDRHRTRVNFRSRDRVDVNRIAKFFGGGGHKNASGTTVEEPLKRAEEKVISFVKRCINRRKGKK